MYPLFKFFVVEYSVDPPILSNQCCYKYNITNVVQPKTKLYKIFTVL